MPKISEAVTVPRRIELKSLKTSSQLAEMSFTFNLPPIRGASPG